MEHFFIENEGINTFLVHPVESTNDIDETIYEKLSSYQIKGLLPVTKEILNEKPVLKYNVSSHISMEQIFSGGVTKSTFLKIFKGIVNTLIDSKTNMLCTNYIILNSRYIYVNVGTKEVELICLPLKDQGNVNIINFFKNIVFKTQFDVTENAEYVEKLITYLSHSENFNLLAFDQILSGLMGQENLQKEDVLNSKVKVQKLWLEGKSSIKEEFLNEVVEEKSKKSIFRFLFHRKNKKNEENVNFEKVDYIPYKEGNVKPVDSDAYLIRLSNNDKINITKPVFKLGTERNHADYYIKNNVTVSPIHANIIRDGNEYFIIDMNSKNHTFVNGKMIHSGVSVKLEHGIKIALSNEAFTFVFHKKDYQ